MAREAKSRKPLNKNSYPIRKAIQLIALREISFGVHCFDRICGYIKRFLDPEAALNPIARIIGIKR
jgi:hypothetical protein